MSVSAADGKKMLFSLRFPPDKILDVIEGSFTAVAASLDFAACRTSATTAHDYGTTVFTQLTYSLDGGATWQDQHTPIPDLSSPSAPRLQTCPVGCYSTSTQIVVTASNYTTSDKTVTYKVVVFSKE